VYSWWTGLLGPPTAASNHQSLTDAVSQGIVPSLPSGSTAPVVNNAVANLSQTVSDLTTQIVALQSSANSPTTILRDSGQDSPGSGLGSDWTRTGVNAINRDAQYGFLWSPSGTTPRFEIGIYNTPLTTNDQIGIIVFNSLMTFWPADFFGGTYYQDGAPENWIILRADTPVNPQNYVFAKIRYDDVQFGYVQAGAAPVMLGSPTTFKSTPSASFAFQVGDGASDYNFFLSSGGHVIASYTDSAHATSFAVGNLYSGQAWKSDYDPGHGAEALPGATSWQSYDAVASAGSPLGFGWVCRVSTSNQTASGTLPYNFFDTVVGSLGAGVLLPTSGMAGLKVAQAGLYACSWGLRQPSTSNATDLVSGISVNGSLAVAGGPTFMYDGGGTLLVGGDFGMSDPGIPLNAGDVIGPSLWSYTTIGNTLTAAGGSWCGEASGVRSWMKIVKVG
jgi:hypothetical protein